MTGGPCSAPSRGTLIDASRTFEEVAEEAYGQRVSFLDDEGWLSQGWEQYVLLDLVLELLAEEATLASPRWEKLVEHLFKARRKYHAVDYVDVKPFFAARHVAKHRAFKRLRAVEKTSRSR